MTLTVKVVKMVQINYAYEFLCIQSAYRRIHNVPLLLPVLTF